MRQICEAEIRSIVKEAFNSGENYADSWRCAQQKSTCIDKFCAIHSRQAIPNHSPREAAINAIVKRYTHENGR